MHGYFFQCRRSLYSWVANTSTAGFSGSTDLLCQTKTEFLEVLRLGSYHILSPLSGSGNKRQQHTSSLVTQCWPQMFPDFNRCRGCPDTTTALSCYKPKLNCKCFYCWGILCCQWTFCRNIQTQHCVTWQMFSNKSRLISTAVVFSQHQHADVLTKALLTWLC